MTTKREFTRVPFHVDATVSLDGAEIQCRQTRDLSLKGIYLICDPSADVGRVCRIDLRLGDPTNPVHTTAMGVVRRIEDDGLAIEFVELDLDTYRLLREVVRYNTKDPAEAEQEFESHIGLKTRPDTE